MLELGVIRKVQLTAQGLLLFKQRHMMAAVCRRQSCLHTGRATTDHCNLFEFLRGLVQLLHLVLNAHQGVNGTYKGNAVDAGRVVAAHTFDAGHHILAPSLIGLGAQIRVCQPTPGHGNEVCLAGCNGVLHLIQILIAADGQNGNLRAALLDFLGHPQVGGIGLKAHAVGLPAGGRMDMEDVCMVLHQLCHFTGIVDGEARTLGQFAGHSQLNQKVLARRLVNGITALV